MSSPLEEIPGVGPRIAAVMEALGIQAVSDLAGADPEELYRRECLMKAFRRTAAPSMCGGRRSIMPSTRGRKRKN